MQQFNNESLSFKYSHNRNIILLKQSILRTVLTQGKSFEKREKRRKKDAEEQAIRQIETKKTTSLPETEDEFERYIDKHSTNLNINYDIVFLLVFKLTNLKISHVPMYC